MWSVCPLKYIRQFINKLCVFRMNENCSAPEESDLEEKKCCEQLSKCSENNQTGQLLLIIISAVGSVFGWCGLGSNLSSSFLFLSGNLSVQSIGRELEGKITKCLVRFPGMRHFWQLRQTWLGDLCAGSDSQARRV